MFSYGGFQAFGNACRTVIGGMTGGRFSDDRGDGGHDRHDQKGDDHKGDDRHHETLGGKQDSQGGHDGHGSDHHDGGHSAHHDGHDDHHGGQDDQDHSGGDHGCGDGSCNGAASGVDITIPENAHVAIMVIENDPGNDTYDDYLRVYSDDVQDPANLNDYIAAAEEEYAARGNSLDSCMEVMKVVVEDDQHQVIKVLYKDADGTFTDHDPSQDDPAGTSGSGSDQTGDQDDDGDTDHGGSDQDDGDHGTDHSGHGHGSGHDDATCGGLFKFGGHGHDDHASRDDHQDDDHGDHGDHGHGQGHHFAFF